MCQAWVPFEKGCFGKSRNADPFSENTFSSCCGVSFLSLCRPLPLWRLWFRSWEFGRCVLECRYKGINMYKMQIFRGTQLHTVSCKLHASASARLILNRQPYSSKLPNAKTCCPLTLSSKTSWPLTSFLSKTRGSNEIAWLQAREGEGTIHRILQVALWSFPEQSLQNP